MKKIVKEGLSGSTIPVKEAKRRTLDAITIIARSMQEIAEISLDSDEVHGALPVDFPFEYDLFEQAIEVLVWRDSVEDKINDFEQGKALTIRQRQRQNKYSR